VQQTDAEHFGGVPYWALADFFTPRLYGAQPERETRHEIQTTLLARMTIVVMYFLDLWSDFWCLPNMGRGSFRGRLPIRPRSI